jgi:hypothetical protein
MIRYLIAALLLTVSLQQGSTLFLTPTYPPTAYYNQYYEVRFRVVGLTQPKFTFTGLPSFLNGTTDGIVSGTPSATGTYKVGLSYTDGTNSGSSNVVISVTSSSYTAASAQQSAAVANLII